MSINTITAPGLLLKYQVAMQSVSRLSEQITLTITRQQAGFCNYLVLYVPVGLSTGNIFTKSPSIKSSLAAWSPVSSVGEQEATLPLPPDDTHSYQRFILYNQNPGASLDSLPLVVTITGSTNTADWTADFLLFESSKVGATDAFTPKRATCTVNKEYSLLLYIDSFVASLDTPDGVVPVTTLLSGQPFRLSWASNGRSYQLFQDGKPLLAVADPSTAAYGQTGNAVFYKIEAGILTDTTFVLQAKSPDETLYASLTATVSNPTYSPSPSLEPIVSTLKSTIAGIDGNLLRNAFRFKRGTEPPVGNKLKNALAATSDATVRTEFFKYCYSFNSFGRRWNDGEDSPQRFGPIVTQLNDTQLKGLLLGTESPPLRNALQATSDVTLRNALRETNFPVLLTLLDQPSNDALKIAIQQQDDAALIPVFEDVQLTNSLGQDSAVKIGVAVADAKAKLGLDNKNFAFISSPDTVRSLRVSNGNLQGNMVFQALTGDNAGLVTLNFNGYFSSGERHFNPNKARYRVGVDQRGGADRFFIDTYQSNKPPLSAAFTINANGFVGIGTNAPDRPLTVQAVGSEWLSLKSADGITRFHLNNLGGGLNIVESGVADYRLFVSPGGNIGIGTSTPTQRLDVYGGISARAYNPIASQGAHLHWNRSGFEGETWLLNQKGGGNVNSGIRFGSSDQVNSVREYARFIENGNFGIGTTSPSVRLEVNGQFKAAVGMQFADRSDQAHNFEWYAQDGRATLYSSATNTQGLTMNKAGKVGIGTLSPRFPLEVAGGSGYHISKHNYVTGEEHNGNGAEVDLTNVSIYASGDILSLVFRAVSDARLKSVVGQSDAAADLALLRRLRITNYTMRDRVQFGNQAFKKLLGQELEEIFPQAVHQHTGFLPDIYARASQVQRQGEALLITLPTGLPTAATAGQRLKLMGPAGEVVATLAAAAEAGSQQLLLAGADSLTATPQEVFVFGLEHADVRSIDYEAVAMLNVSATQALAQQVEELHQQNAALNEQNQAQGTQLAALQAALHLLQEQVAALALGSSSLVTNG